MRLLTEEMVEKAARAMHGEMEKFWPILPWEALHPLEQKEYGQFARAALEAVLPDVVEECAKYIENPRNLKGRRSLRSAANAIRSLLGKGE